MGIPERKERERQQKRNLILDSAEKLFFSQGFGGTSMEEIAKEAEYSKGTIYLYFKSKEELIANIHLRGMNLLYRMFREYSKKETNGLAKLERIGRANFEFMGKYHNYYMLMKMFDSMEINYENVGSVMLDISDKGKHIIEYMVSCIVEGQNDGSVNKELDPEKTAHVLAGTSAGMFQWISKLNYDPASNNEAFSDELVEEFFHILYFALKGNKN